MKNVLIKVVAALALVLVITAEENHEPTEAYREETPHSVTFGR